MRLQISTNSTKNRHTGDGYQAHRLEKQLDKIDASKKKLHQKWETYQKEREEKGLFCCRKMDVITKDRCMRVFYSSVGRDRHENQSKCKFPPKDLATHMHLLHLDGNIAFCLATGSMTNRCEATDANGVTIRDGDEAIKNKVWFKRGCYNTVRKKNVRASKALLADLEYLFLAGLQRDNIEKGGANKYTPLEAVTFLLNLKLPDGRRKYSHDDDNKNGPPPTVKYVKSWFARRARQEVENSNGMSTRENEGSEGCYKNMSLLKLKSMARSQFGMKRVTRKRISMLLLELYNELENIPDYESLVKESNFEKQCEILKLCCDENDKSTYIKLFELRDRVEKMKICNSSNSDSNDSDSCASIK